MKVEISKVRKIRMSDIPKLDPVTAILEDYEHGKGKIIIECYGKSWSSYWGAMGTDIASFFIRTDEHYLANKLSSIPEEVIADTEQIREHAWQKLVEIVETDPEHLKDGVDIYQERISNIDRDFLNDSADLFEELYGYGWRCDLPKVPNVDYLYLCRIINAVKAGLKVSGERPQ